MFLVPERPEEGIQFPETRVTDGCSYHVGNWDLDWGPLEEQASVLTVELSLQTPVVFIYL